MKYIIVYKSGKEMEVCGLEFMQTILSLDGSIKIIDGLEYFFVD